MGKVIKVENLSKAYQIGQFTTGTLSQDINRWWAIKRGKEDPFLKIGEANDRETKGTSDVVWSLRNINFEVEQGDAIGIIGKNGAGKSTLLKILSQVTTPTTGSIKVKGRVASLLEVGTGFHPELTGRENIFLNGAILGMREKEILRKFDEIVDFSGVERYIDTPVKRYSSGMYVRLAFAVAAYLESEILIVDEVLAVGDAEFQKKCMGKMGEVSKGEGRTVLFVSHNMQMVTALCRKSIILKNGQVVGHGFTEDIISNYLNPEITNSVMSDFRGAGAGKHIRIISANIKNPDGLIYYNQDISVEVEVSSLVDVDTDNLRFSYGLNDMRDRSACVSCTNEAFSLKAFETKKLLLTLNKNKHLMPGKYKIGLNLLEGHQLDSYISKDNIYGYLVIEILNDDSAGGFHNLHRWNQGWGSILFDSTLEVLN